MHLFTTYLIYLIVGIIFDIIYTFVISSISKNEIWKSVCGSWLLTMVSYTVLHYLLLSPEFFWNLFFFATGGSIGTYIILRKKL